ncbi:hypothetical protein Tco_1351332 [Tanacetum coccineum]
MVEKDEYNRLSKRFFELEQHCISLEIAMQLNKEFFQKNNTSVNQIEPSFNQLFELNNLKAELQAKDITIEKLKTNIKRLNKTSTTNNVKKDIDEIGTINIKLEHREKVFVITSLKNDLRKFKGKDIVDNAVQASNDTTIPPGMYKLDPVTLDPKDKNNRETHIYYLKHTMEQAAILREIVEQAYSLNPLNSASYYAYKYVKLIQELLGYVRDTCPDIHKPRVNPSTSASGSKPSGNTKNDRISMEPGTSQGSDTSVAPSSSSLIDCRLSKLFCGIWTPVAPKESHDLEFAHMSNDPYFGIPILETVYEESSSSDVISTTVHSDAPILEHPIEPKTYKDALTQSCWIEAMQEELHEFERLEV